MDSSRVAAFLILLAVAFPFQPARAATPQQVDAAIKKARDFLRSQQKKDGSFGDEPKDDNQYGGRSSMATYALLAAGDSPQDEHIKRAVHFIGNANITGIYALGLRAQVWPYLKMNSDVRTAVIRDAELLLKSAQKGTGRWGYSVGGGGEHNSPTQYGVLGLWACARAGYEVPGQFWKMSEQGWLDCQCQDGGWQYESTRQEKSRDTMTVAGIASLFIAQDYLRANDGIKCTGNISNPNIEAGLKRISENFNPAWQDGYLLYGIERVGVASGYKYFGKHDWYAAGAETLVKTQAADGSWNSHGTIPGTAFGIFFLTRGRAPVVMNKLQYEFNAPTDSKKKRSDKDKVANWNQRPRDAANVVRWIGAHMERDLNWQIVNLKVGAADLLDAPILYIAGNQQLDLSKDDKAKLKSYVEQGGLILGQADCGKADFAKSFRQLGTELFPAYDFRELPPVHPVFNEQFSAAKWKTKIQVEGLSNGARELMLLIPKDDVSRSWQTQSSATKDHHFALASNIFLYAVDRSNLRFKGETYVLKPDPSIKPTRTIKLARIRYGGNWDPEPGGWRRLAAYLLNQHKLGLQVDVAKLGEDGPSETAASAAPAKAAGKSPRPAAAAAPRASASKSAAAPATQQVISLKGYDVAHLTGTTAFKLDDAARGEIRGFIESGGTLLVDATGGSTAFAEAAEAELAAIFESDASQLAAPLKPAHAVYTLPASKVTEVAYRNFARDKLGRNLKSPRLRGIETAKRTAVFYSKEDLSTGLVGQSVDGIYGYDPKSAAQLVANVILYATGEGKTSTTQPTTQPTTTPTAAK